MSIQQMIEQVHDNAKAKGFWTHYERTDDTYNARIAQKLALISTEVAEFEAEAFERRPDSMLEELADVVIRVFDLCGYLGIELPDDVLSIRIFAYGGASGVASALYREVALAVQSHRKECHDFELHLENIVRFAQDFTCGTYSDTYALRRAIEVKMQKNESREYRHGAAY